MAKVFKQVGKSVSLELIDEPAGRIRLEISEEGIRELADSIDSVGQLQPILLRPVGDRLEIVFGHRRFLATRLLKRKKIDATVRELDDVEVALMRATENVVSLRLSPIEEAAVYVDLRDTHKLAVEDIAKRMGKSVGVVKRRMDLLKMPDCLQKAVHFKQIGYSVAEELWSLGDLGKIEYYLGFAADHGATQAVVRTWVQDEKKKERTKAAGTEVGDSLAYPMQSKPVYVACDLCLGSMEIGSETVFRACGGCVKLLKEANIVQ